MVTEEELFAQLMSTLGATKEKTDSHLEKVLGELHSECRAFRDTEFKILSAYLSTMSFVFAASAVLISRSEDICANSFSFITGLAIIFCILLTLLIIYRIRHDHLIYEELFFRVRVIRKYWGFQGFFPTRQLSRKKQIEAGKGTGWLQSAILVGMTALFVLAVIGYAYMYAPVKLCS